MVKLNHTISRPSLGIWNIVPDQSCTNRENDHRSFDIRHLDLSIQPWRSRKGFTPSVTVPSVLSSDTIYTTHLPMTHQLRLYLYTG